jgi:prevent-host-death family protein
MKTITIRELHAKTGQSIRLAAQHGEILVTHHGRGVAKIVPHTEEKETPYFSRRKLTPAFRKLAGSGRLRGAKDSAQGISEDREDRGL